MDRKILIIDDEKNILRSLELILKPEGYHVLSAGNLKQAKEILEKQGVLICLVDVMLPDGDGIDFIATIREKQPGAVIIMISGHASIKMAIEATKQGADDFLEKPLSREKMLITLNNFIKRLELQDNISTLQQNLYGAELIGDSPALQTVRREIDKIAPTNSKVLITGESGTGKEIVARLIHQKSRRRGSAYIKINCAAIPEELIEAELFGAEKGAYTGATERREGKFKQADGGTLFLDEIGDMSLQTQTKVLRVLQDGAFERVGGSETIKTDVRIVAATNKDLSREVKSGSFREDLYFRLHVVPIHLPPLREREGDIPQLVHYYLSLFSAENNKPLLEIEPAVMQRLREHSWPGNVRELKNVIERMVIMAEDNVITSAQIPADLLRPAIDVSRSFKQNESLREFRERIEMEYIALCLEQSDGNVAEAAAILQVDRTYLYKKLRKLGLR